MDFEKIVDKVESASLDESRAINKILLDAMEADRKERRKDRRTSKVCATICVVAFLLTAVLLGVLASGVTIETSTTKESITPEKEAGTMYTSLEMIPHITRRRESNGKADYQKGDHKHKDYLQQSFRQKIHARQEGHQLQKAVRKPDLPLLRPQTLT